jgi:hypothetical protein
MTVFENVPCTRCGGSGKFSFNAVHGDMCYGCKGTGYTLTKRGQAAYGYLIGLRNVKASDIAVGDLVQFEDITVSYFVRIESIHIMDTGLIQLRGTHRGNPLTFLYLPNKLVRKGWSGGEKAAQLAKAVAYQSTLTKAGKVNKRKAKDQS